MIKIQENVLLKDYTTLEIGGPARYFVEVRTPHELTQAIKYAKENNLEYFILAGGSDLLISDDGFNGLVVKCNLEGSSYGEEGRASSDAAVNLHGFVNLMNSQGLAGIEKLAGIPGTVGGAIYGNAGAFGQTISDKLLKVKILIDGKERWKTKEELKFDYRESILKEHKDWVIIKAEFQFDLVAPEDLEKTSKEVLETRAQKYTPGIKCPGSFFKNLIIERLPENLQKDMPKDYYGKVPAWWFLEKVGAKGATRGKIKIADHHANLFTNLGGGTAADFFTLAQEYKDKVKEKFGIELEPEVQLVGFKEEL
jgi:UDP-N-acetylmuramate dehydrogenase